MAKAFYKLKNTTCFWDRTQPQGGKNKIVGDQIVELEETTKVLKARSTDAIVKVEKGEYEDYLKSQGVEVKTAAKKPTTVKAKGTTTINTDKK